MGNCVFKDHETTTTSTAAYNHHHTVAEQAAMIKVVTSNGGIMELYAPITAEQITSEFPGHGLFRGPNPAQAHSGPLLPKDQLHPGLHPYYLLPLNTSLHNNNKNSTNSNNNDPKLVSSSTPYRMSFDGPNPKQLMLKRPDPTDVVPRYNGTGVWKVRLVINPEQLSEILSQDARTEELIESVRTVAKCGNAGGVTSAPASVSGGGYSSDQGGSSVSSRCNNGSWKAGSL